MQNQLKFRNSLCWNKEGVECNDRKASRNCTNTGKDVLSNSGYNLKFARKIDYFCI